MLSTKEFAEWSQKVVLFLHNTSRVEDEPYPHLLREKGGNGFPTVSFLDAEGTLLELVGHVTPVDQLEAAFQRLRHWQELRAAVSAGKADAAQEKELFLLELKMGNRPYAEMLQRRDRLTWSDDEGAQIRQHLVNLQFRDILVARGEDLAAAGKEYLAMYREQRIPDSAQDTSFWQGIFARCVADQDATTFAAVLADLKVRKQGDRRLERYLVQLEQQLEQLKAGGGK